MSNAEVILPAKEVFTEDLGELWEVWDEKPKWISAKELYQEDAQAFWDSWEDNPRLATVKELSPLRSSRKHDSESSESSESENETLSANSDAYEEDEGTFPKTGLVSAKEFFKDDECWWNDTVEDLEKPKVISAKEFFNENKNWWENDEEESGEETDSEYSESSESQFSLEKAVPAKEFFREDECWWRDAEEELGNSKGVTAKEFFKEDLPWWVTEDENEYSTNKAIPAKEVFKEESSWWEEDNEHEFDLKKAIPANELFKEDSSWLDNETDDKNDDDDEAYESIISDTSTMFSASEGSTSSQYQECDWWLSPENSEVTNSIVKAKDMFKEDAWWDETNENSEETETQECPSLSKDSLSEEDFTHSDEETQAESIIEDEEDGINDIDERALEEELSVDEEQFTETAVGTIQEPLCESSNEEKCAKMVKNKLSPSLQDSLSNSDQTDLVIEEIKLNRVSEIQSGINNELVSDQVTAETNESLNTENLIYLENPLYNKDSKSLSEESDDASKSNLQIAYNNPNQVDAKNANSKTDFADMKATREPKPEGCSQSTPDAKTEVTSSDHLPPPSDSYQKVVNKMDRCLAELDARIAQVDIQLKETSDLGCQNAVQKKEFAKDLATSKCDAEDEGKKPAAFQVKGKFDVIRVNVCVGDQKGVLLSNKNSDCHMESRKITTIPSKLGESDKLFDDLVSGLITQEIDAKVDIGSKVKAESFPHMGTISKATTEVNTIENDSMSEINDETNIESDDQPTNDPHAIPVSETVTLPARNQENSNFESSSLSEVQMERMPSVELLRKNEDNVRLSDTSSPESTAAESSSGHISPAAEDISPSPSEVSLCDNKDLPLSRESSVELDCSRNESPILVANRGIWRCSTYDEITLSQYDKLAAKITGDPNFGLMEKSSVGNLKHMSENSPANDAFENTNKMETKNEKKGESLSNEKELQSADPSLSFTEDKITHDSLFTSNSAEEAPPTSKSSNFANDPTGHITSPVAQIHDNQHSKTFTNEDMTSSNSPQNTRQAKNEVNPKKLLHSASVGNSSPKISLPTVPGAPSQVRCDSTSTAPDHSLFIAASCFIFITYTSWRILVNFLFDT